MPYCSLAIVAWPALAVRVGFIVVSLGAWFATQAWIEKRPAVVPDDGGALGDGVHRLTAPWNRHLHRHRRQADLLLFSSTLVIDLLGLYLIGSAVFGKSFQPFLGLFLLFVLRQICQAFCPLPPPPGMIWRSPGFSALLVTYGTSNDLFFSGHTAIAVYGSLCLATAFGPLGLAAGLVIASFEILTVLVLRAHYTADVFAGAITALYVHHLVTAYGPWTEKFFG